MSDVDDTTLEQAEAADAAEWDSAFDKFDSEKGLEKESTKEDVESENSLEPGEKEHEAADEEKEEEANKADDNEADEAAEREARERAQAAREARAIQRETLVEAESMQNDIVEQMFKDKDGKLYDADGDEIRTIEDVMGLRNPNTGKNFTEEEAATWLIRASQSVQREREEALAMAKTYAEVNLTIKDEADTIKDKYGEFLADPKNHALRDEVLQDYLNTLVVDEESGIVTKAPVSMVRFYDRALKPYVDAQNSISSAEEARKQAEADAEKARKEAEAARTRSDREDIFDRGTSGRDTLSKEEQEWADVEKSYYGRK